MTSIAPFDYRLGVHLPDRVSHHDWRPANHHPGRFWKAWITGVSQYMLDPGDPWPSGYPAF